ncbi:hypothetical protein SAMN02745883_01993 [Caminicella sporogenes DSM 14501]|uniref:Uncharacterized protein n=1 Tax=Caminicella sporogenes DSM 14501 TaxID=1121266 RepID=A0A1M6S9N7_9FIRM|nr:hypothetical protein [Caminicella sporogenes]RKD26925.1 hypothetical protein BET04_09950 [Caminicella sporogenes]WIF95910.1 hypothetical protein QNI18_04675 [Caminicella sporogenes]SHK41473.1 hypothetical protein SAMN02745883_01993 [Caminicella sporogenes DSM 14501]
MKDFNLLDVYSKLGDLKEINYRNILAIATIIELLIEKGIISRQEFTHKAYIIDNMSTEELKILRTMNR